MKTNHQRILYKPFCSFLMEPVCASAYQSVISYRKWQLPKTLGKQGSQTIFNVTQRTKTSSVFRVRDLSTSNDAVSQQIPVILWSRPWWHYFIQWLLMDLTVVTGGQYHFFFGSLKNLSNGDVIQQDFTFCHLKKLKGLLLWNPISTTGQWRLMKLFCRTGQQHTAYRHVNYLICSGTDPFC